MVLYMDVVGYSLSMLSLFVRASLLSTNKNLHCKELNFPIKLFSFTVAWRGSQEWSNNNLFFVNIQQFLQLSVL